MWRVLLEIIQVCLQILYCYSYDEDLLLNYAPQQNSLKLLLILCLWMLVICATTFIHFSNSSFCFSWSLPASNSGWQEHPCTQVNVSKLLVPLYSASLFFRSANMFGFWILPGFIFGLSPLGWFPSPLLAFYGLPPDFGSYGHPLMSTRSLHGLPWLLLLLYQVYITIN